jgi:hypothetical protein
VFQIGRQGGFWLSEGDKQPIGCLKPWGFALPERDGADFTPLCQIACDCLWRTFDDLGYVSFRCGSGDVGN